MKRAAWGILPLLLATLSQAADTTPTPAPKSSLIGPGVAGFT